MAFTCNAEYLEDGAKKITINNYYGVGRISVASVPTGKWDSFGVISNADMQFF